MNDESQRFSHAIVMNVALLAKTPFGITLPRQKRLFKMLWPIL
jgi:hypothetical protein